jgi:hypothetical protein
MNKRFIYWSALVAMLMALSGAVLIPGGSIEASSYDGALHWLYASGSATGGKRVHLRVVLTKPAPDGGVNIPLSSSDPSIPVPAYAHVDSGQTEEIVGITTVPVLNTKNVTVTATYAGVSRSKTVTIFEPVHSSLSVQSRIRAGGLGKVIVRLSGRAPAGGITVNMSTNTPAVFLIPATAYIPAGAASATLKVSATSNQVGDTYISVTSLYPKLNNTFTKNAIVRHYDVVDPTATPTNTEVPTATATNTEVPTATATNTEVPTATPTNTEVPTATATDTEVPTATATNTEVPTATPTNTEVPTATPTETEVPTATPTNTEVPTATNTAVPTATATNTAVPQPLAISAGATTVARGSVVPLTVCLVASPSSDVTISWAPQPDSPFLNASNYGSTTILAGATGQDLCVTVPFAGLNNGGGKPTGTAHMVFTVNGVTQDSPDITWQ